jgi:hypothetical protein
MNAYGQAFWFRCDALAEWRRRGRVGVIRWYDGDESHTSGWIIA